MLEEHRFWNCRSILPDEKIGKRVTETVLVKNFWHQELCGGVEKEKHVLLTNNAWKVNWNQYFVNPDADGVKMER